MRRQLAMLALAVGAWSVFRAGTVNTQSNSTINLNPNVTHQTMNGWEATDEAAAFDNANFSTGTNNRNPRFAVYKDALLSAAVNDVGINRIRLEVRPGFENTVDYFSQYLDGKIPKNQMAVGRGAPTNDNADPNVLNASGFVWGELDFKIDNIVKPLRDRLLARGETLHVNASFIGADDPNVFQKTPAEYAEFMMAVYQHMQQKYGFVPDTWEVMNEPDLSAQYSNWTAQQIGHIIATAGPKLAQQGITARFGTPSVAQANFTFTWWDQIVAMPGVLPYISEYVYHRYGSPPTVAEMNAIRDRAAQHGKTTAQLENLVLEFRRTARRPEARQRLGVAALYIVRGRPLLLNRLLHRRCFKSKCSSRAGRHASQVLQAILQAHSERRGQVRGDHGQLQL